MRSRCCAAGVARRSRTAEFGRWRSLRPADWPARSGYRVTSRERLLISSMPASASVRTNDHAALRRRRSGEREAPGSARACPLVPASSGPPSSRCCGSPSHGSAAIQPICSRRIGSCSPNSSIGVMWRSRGRRSNGRQWPTAPRSTISVTGSRPARWDATRASSGTSRSRGRCDLHAGDGVQVAVS